MLTCLTATSWMLACGEGSYDAYLYKALGDEPAIVGFDLSKETVRLAAKLLPEAAFCVGGSFCAPVRDGWADLLLNIFSPFAGARASAARCARADIWFTPCPPPATSTG